MVGPPRLNAWQGRPSSHRRSHIFNPLPVCPLSRSYSPDTRDPCEAWRKPLLGIPNPQQNSFQRFRSVRRSSARCNRWRLAGQNSSYFREQCALSPGIPELTKHNEVHVKISYHPKSKYVYRYKLKLLRKKCHAPGA